MPTALRKRYLIGRHPLWLFTALHGFTSETDSLGRARSLWPGHGQHWRKRWGVTRRRPAAVDYDDDDDHEEGSRTRARLPRPRHGQHARLATDHTQTPPRPPRGAMHASLCSALESVARTQLVRVPLLLNVTRRADWLVHFSGKTGSPSHLLRLCHALRWQRPKDARCEYEPSSPARRGHSSTFCCFEARRVM